MNFIRQSVAKAIDEDLMSITHGFSIDQLMELAGLAVAEAFTRMFTHGTKPIVVCGPGNNGGDGLVAARHLRHFGYEPVVVYPRETQNDLYLRLLIQCRQLDISIGQNISEYVNSDNICFIDAMFGFGFRGSPRPPFDKILLQMKDSNKPILSVDVPSGWDVEHGDVDGNGISPVALVSLTAPKMCARTFEGRHFVGGRFIPHSLALKYNLTIPSYEGTCQIHEISK